jgi:TRAP-type C4-dicarboxylate transport system permease small subunit
MRKGLELVCVLLLGTLVAVPFIQILAREIFGAAIVGAEELTRFLLICTVFVAYPLVVSKNENIVMAELREALPPKLRRAVWFLIVVAGIATCGFLGWVAIQNIMGNMRGATPTLKIPFWIFMGATAFGFAGACIVHVLQLRRANRAQNSVAL